MWDILPMLVFVLLNTKIDGKYLNREEITEDINAIEDEVNRLSSSLRDLIGQGHSLNDLDDLDDDEEGKTALDRIEQVNENADVNNVEEVDIMEEVKNDTAETTQRTGNDKRNALRDPRFLWTNRDIPYELDANLTKKAVAVIPIAMGFISNHSCIKFHKKTTNDKKWLLFFKGPGCWSYVGRTGMVAQRISIGVGCEYKGIIMHEILHALGFYHEQSRYDRDKFVEIKYENILKGREKNFNKLTMKNSRNLNTPYDYQSIMHYSKTAFSGNGRDVIVVLKNSKLKLGQRNTLSKEDIVSLERLYQCQNKNSLGQNAWTDWSNFGPCHMITSNSSDFCYKRRYRFCGGDSCACSIKNITGERLCTNDNEVCTDAECKLNGHWGHWGLWSSCSAKENCKIGRKRSTRKCDNPAPLKAGANCTGNGTKETECEGFCPQKCTFNENMCGYTVDGLWRRAFGATKSILTGPPGDVDGDGMYMYTEVSGEPRYTVSRMQSQEFNATTGPRCFSLKYHMYGLTMGNLSAYLTAGAVNEKKWERAGNQGNRWKEAKFNVSSTVPFKMTFVAISGTSWKSDSALDNLFLHDKPCAGVLPPKITTVPPTSPKTPTIVPPVTTTTLPPVSPVPSTTLPPVPPVPSTTLPPVPPVSPTTAPPGNVTTTPVTIGSLLNFSCSFRNLDLCGMTIVTSYLRVSIRKILHWEPKNVGHWTEPIQDHVAERGYFLAVHAENSSDIEKTSTIRTPSFIGAGPQSIEFFYYMWNRKTLLGIARGSLEVSIVEENSVKYCILFAKTGSPNAAWVYAKVDVDVAHGVTFYLKFTAILGKEKSTIAIDDIRGVHRGISTAKNTIPSPSVMSCSFNTNSLCSWKPAGDFEWTPTSGTTKSLRTGPPYPGAVTQSVDDKFIYAEASLPQKQNDVAIIKSPLMFTSTPMCLVFFSNTFGKGIGSLKVGVIKLEKNGTRTHDIRDITKTTCSRAWNEQRVELPSHKIFGVAIKATVGIGPEGDIAIDNIITIPGKCGKRTHEETTSCDFEDIKNCRNIGIKGYNFILATEAKGKLSNDSILNSYYKAKLNEGWASVKFTLQNVDQFGACLTFQYRLQTENDTIGDIEVKILQRSSSLMLRPIALKLVKAIPEGSYWLTQSVTIPPRASKENIEIKIHANFGSQSGDVKELDIDNIRNSNGICKLKC